MSKKKKTLALELAAQGLYEQAIHHLKLLARKYSNDFEIWYCLGMCQVGLQEYNNAKLSLTRAAKINNKHPVIHQALAEVLVKNNEYKLAIKHYKVILKLGVNDVNVCVQLGNCYKYDRQTNHAINAYLNALEISSASVEASSNLAIIYEQKHDIVSARRYAEHAVKFEPLDVDSHLLISKLDSREKNYGLARTRLENLLTKSLSHYQLGGVCMELASILDKQLNYSEVFNYLSKAKSSFKLIPHIQNYNPAAYIKTINNQPEFFTKSLVSNWFNNSFDPLEGGIIFLVGFPRSGTTLTEQILESHEDIVSTHELPVFMDILSSLTKILGRSFDSFKDVALLSDADVCKLRGVYRDDLSQRLHEVDIKGKTILDKLPLNTTYLGFIARIFPDSKVLVALHDPRDVCLSCYMQAFQLDGAMLQFLDIDSTGRFYSAVMKLLVYYKSVLKLDILQTRYEDVVDDLEGSARRIIEFVGVEWNPNILKYHVSAKNRMVFTPSYEAVTKPIYHGSINRWKNYETELESIIPYLQPFIDEFGYQS